MKKFEMSLLIGLLLSSNAWATLNLKNVQVVDTHQVDLIFDGKVIPNQIKTDYINDIIQLSISDSSVYPAKISSVSNAAITKIFAYQYSPKLVRCRLSVKGKALDYQAKVKLIYEGKTVKIKFTDGSVNAVVASKQKRNVDELRTSSSSVVIKKEEPIKLQEGEQEILNRVLKSATETKIEAPIKTKEKESRLLKPIKTFGVLALVISVFVALAYGFKRLVLDKSDQRKGLSKFLGSLKGVGKKDKVIEHVATHYLGPKKSISVVKIAGKLLVLGVTAEHISLISQLNSEDDIDHDFLTGNITESTEKQSGAGATSAGKPVFSDILTTENGKPSFRNKIKNRLEGMKQL